MIFSRRPTYSEQASSSTRVLLSEGMAAKSKLSRLLTAGNFASASVSPLGQLSGLLITAVWAAAAPAALIESHKWKDSILVVQFVERKRACRNSQRYSTSANALDLQIR